MTITALTIRQPWAGLIAAGAKRFETRTWPAPTRLVGSRLAIHAGAAAIDLGLSDDAIAAIEDGLGLQRAHWPSLPFGAVIATARVIGAYQVDERGLVDGRVRIKRAIDGSAPLTCVTLKPDEAHFGDYGPGVWLWRLEDVELLTPPAKIRGRQRLWAWTSAIDDAGSSGTPPRCRVHRSGERGPQSEPRALQARNVANHGLVKRGQR